MDNRFEVNTYVRYAASGICLIEAITCMVVPGMHQKMNYYVLHPIDNRSSAIYVPVDNEAMTASMLPVPTREETERMLQSISMDEMEWIEDRKERTEAHREILRRCDCRELVILVGSFYLRRKALAESGRKLAGSDEAAFRQAERLINSELGFALGIEENKVSEYIRNTLDVK